MKKLENVEKFDLLPCSSYHPVVIKFIIGNQKLFEAPFVPDSAVKPRTLQSRHRRSATTPVLPVSPLTYATPPRRSVIVTALRVCL